MTEHIAQAEQLSQTDWPALIFSWPSAVFAVCATAIFLSIVYVFSPRFGKFLASRKFIFGFGDKRVEVGPAEPLALEPVNESGSTSVQPPVVEGADEPQTEAREDELALEDDSELTLRRKIIIAAYGDRDLDKVEAIYEKWKAIENRESSDEDVETVRSRLRLRLGVEAAEDELRELERETVDWIDPSLALKDHFKRLARIDLAIPHAQIAIDRSIDDPNKAFCAREMADLLLESENAKGALDLLNNTFLEITDDESKANVLDKIADIHKANKDDQMEAKTLEFALQLTPSEKSRRFRLAYLYSDKNRNLLSLFHYRILADQDAHYSSTLNNLGAIYDKLKLPGKSVEAWRTGSNRGETYPRGNLVIELIQHGFYHEAQQILDNTSPEDRESVRITQAVSSLVSHKTQENKKLDKYTEDTKIHHKYMLLAVETEQRAERKSVTENDLKGSWVSVDEPKNQLDFSISDDGVCQITLSETVPGGGLGAFGSVVRSSTKTFKVYSTLSGLTLTASAHLDKIDQPVGLLGLLGQEKIRNLFLVVTDNVTMQGFYWSEETSPKEVLFKRQ